ncbi:TPA: tyrosine-type recombinase/integrase [Vibrio parahaemolyticus]|nr:tyrosine-type recombinase/integrase [Vibrio fluvialis]HCE2179564.1 tyrosine-type recombinase/integrase [Vibrio parahaemolyticus]
MMNTKSNKPLSNRAIETLTFKKGLLSDIGENRGLRVACGKTGRKSFFYRFRSPENDKKLVQIKLGTYPAMSLEEARIKLRKLKKIRDTGVCPKAELERRKKAKQEEELIKCVESITIKDVVEKFLSEHIEDRRLENGAIKEGARKPKGQKETRRIMYKDVVDIIGDMSAVQVSRKDVIDLIMRILERGANVQAGSVLRELSSAFEFCIGIGYLPFGHVNPAKLAKDSFKASGQKLTNGKRDRVLTKDELIRFLEWLPESKFSQSEQGILKLTLWTGCRTGEICSLEWENINFSKGTAYLPETKNGKPRTVQLPRQAQRWLKERKLQSRSKYVFPNRGGINHFNQKVLTQSTWRMRRDGTMLDIDAWSPHDLRRTVRTQLAGLKCPLEVAETILGHTLTGVLGNYNLHSYEDECREWLQIWADEMDRLNEERAVDNSSLVNQ